MDWQQYITSEKDIRSGKPIIRGTRLTVELIIGRLADGWTYDQLLENYPTLKAEHIQAALAFVNECMIDGMLLYSFPRKAG
ncbi:MAG: DUF433 domain-containing protein [Flavobacteriales bacterium]|nr:DUF433 domain-containing protein [Flavobacteriales bacterium]MBK6945589.1 DUF433 domain-containing protein [Flavobacteriales bacterium]MBK7241704.1 DUF433 domain-containing protein [Flavobacteriales bacterium]MBK7296306.1 DUF433 domain-containing protein [Flavobacteriales bacterium]MBK9534857.1 DUF433 domain-containing protein [Flavobacteriales bacterium]